MADAYSNGVYENTDTLQLDPPLSSQTVQLLTSLNQSNAVTSSIAPIQAIQAIAGKQSFSSSIMGRGLLLDSFNSIDSLSNWQDTFPYLLLVLQVDAEGGYSVVASFRLPINPQEYINSAQYAIKTTVTSRGILEEHNGIPLKQISLRGTTGFYINRQKSLDGSSQVHNILGTIFAGTVSAVQNVQGQLNQLSQTIGTSNTPAPGLQAAQTDGNLVMSGYYQYHLLRLFLETYVEVKTKPGTQGIRLALSVAKDRVTYLVTPNTFVTQRSVASPMEYLYTLNLTAWGTVTNLGFATNVDNLQDQISSSTNSLQNALNGLRQLRNVMTSLSSVVSAVQADIQSNILGPINNMILLVKDAIGLAKTVADFPANLRASLQNSIVANWNSLKTALASSPALTTAGPVSPVNPGVIAQITNTVNQIIQQNSGSTSFTQINASYFAPGLLNNLALTDAINVSQLQLTPQQITSVNTAVNNALDTTNNEINALITNLQSVSAALEPSISVLDPLDPQWDILYYIADTVTNLYGLMTDGTYLTSPNTNTQSAGSSPLQTSALSFFEQSTADAQIPYIPPTGKYAIPLPMGYTIEDVASVYLGDPTRWIEIAALNGLQYPYIDTNGFVKSFIDNGFENQFTIGDITNLFIGQTIYLSSNTQMTTKTTIARIDAISSTDFIVTVNNANVNTTIDLSLFTVTDNAQVMAYLPYTLNPMQSIFIPSAGVPTNNELNTTPITFLTGDPNLIKMSRIDWLLDSTGDLAVSQNGFQNLAAGVTNFVQAAKLKLLTPQGGLQLHPGFGLPLAIGENIADVDPQTLQDGIINSFASDERFDTPSAIQITSTPGVEAISLVVSAAQPGIILPITTPLS